MFDHAHLFYKANYYEEFFNELEEIVLGDERHLSLKYGQMSHTYSNYFNGNYENAFGELKFEKLPNITINLACYESGSNYVTQGCSYLFGGCAAEEINLTLKYWYTDSYSMWCVMKRIVSGKTKVLNLKVPKYIGRGEENFRYASNLETINVINYDDNNSEGFYLNSANSYIFDGCTNLKNVKFKEIWYKLQLGSGSSYGHLLTIESLLSAIQACKTSTSSQTLTIGSANVTKLADVYVKVVDETNTNYYPFIQCTSTDEGAMTIQDYLALKNWNIA